MAWSDEPTKSQLFAVNRLIESRVTTPIRVLAIDYLERVATRRDVSNELHRLRDLYIDHKLTKSKVFESDIWEGFDPEEEMILKEKAKEAL